MLSVVLILIVNTLYCPSEADTWFVSQEGNDQNILCTDASVACSSIYFALLVAAQIDTSGEAEIYVYGQNLTLSKEINGDVPICSIPTFFSFASSITTLTITFDSSITTLDDWYDVEFCQNEGNSAEYLMEHISSQLILNNFIWNNYEFNNNYGRVSRIYGGCIAEPGFPIPDDVTFNNCKFNNIVVNNTYDEDSILTGANAIIHGQKMTFNNCEFNNISIYSSTTFAEFPTISFIANEGVCHATQANDIHELVFNYSYFNNIYSVHSLIFANNHFGHSANRNFLIQHTTFNDITVLNSIIIFSAVNSEATIANTKFTNIKLGLIYMEQFSMFINMFNITISSSQLLEEYDSSSIYLGTYSQYALFSVLDGSTHNLDTIHYTVLYSENIKQHCHTTFTTRDVDEYIDAFGFGVIIYRCKNPLSLIDSHGTIIINNLNIYNDVTDIIIDDFEYWVFNSNESVFYNYSHPTNASIIIDFRFEDEFIDHGYYPIIKSEFQIDMNHINIYGLATHDILLNNYGIATVNNLNTVYDYFCVANNSVECIFNPNMLRFRIWIQNELRGGALCQNELIINNSNLYGAWVEFIYSRASLGIFNSTFEYSTTAMFVSSITDSLTIQSSTFRKIGPYYADINTLLSFYLGLVTTTIQVGAHNIIIDDCIFDLYNPDGYILLSPELFGGTSNSYTIISNTNFSINFEDLRWKLNDNPIINNEPYLFFYYGLVMALKYTHLRFMNNYFNGNSYDLSIPFLYINNAANDNCLSGNTIFHYAISVRNSTLSSCYRQNCIGYLDENECWNGGFGEINTDITTGNMYNLFVNNISNISIFTSRYSFIAFDHTIFYLTNDIGPAPYSIANLYDTSMMILDSELMADSQELQVDFVMHYECNISCHRSINDSNSIDNLYQIQQLQVICPLEVLQPSMTKNVLFNNETVAEYTVHQTPTILNLFAIDSYSPGQFLQIGYFITDSNGVTIANFSFESSFIIHLTVIQFAFQNQITIIDDDECFGCDNIYLPFIGIGTNNTNKQFAITTMIDNNELFVNDLLINVENCKSGYGVTGLAQQCVECIIGTYNLLDNHMDGCYDCNDANGNNFVCMGRNVIMITYNHWVGIRNITNNDEISDVFENDDINIVSSQCPFSYCCQNTNGCNFVNSYYFVNVTQQTFVNSNLDLLCARNRDPDSILCGSCLPGYSELIASSQCGVCSHDYIERIIYPVLFAWIVTAYIIFSDAKAVQNLVDDDESEKKCCKWCKCKCCKCKCFKCITRTFNYVKDKIGEEMILIFNIIFIKLIIYYYQGISYIFLYGVGLSNSYLIGFIQLFNLSTNDMGSDGNGYCFLQNMDAKTEIILPLIIIGTIVITLCVLFFYLAKCSKTGTICSYKVNFSKSMAKTLLLCIGQILAILFKILSCKTINNISVHFYFGNTLCYDTTWIVAFMFLIVIIFIFVILFVILCIKNKSQTLGDNNFFNSFIKSYKDEFYYWEFIIILRRLCLALFTIGEFFQNEAYSFFILILVLLIYLLLNKICRPFIRKEINDFEFTLILFTIMLLVMDIIFNNYNNINVNETDKLFIQIVASLFVFIPIIIFCILICYFRILTTKSEHFDNFELIGSSLFNNKKQSDEMGSLLENITKDEAYGSYKRYNE